MRRVYHVHGLYGLWWNTRYEKTLSSMGHQKKKPALIVGSFKPHSQISTYDMFLIFREVNVMSMTTDY